MSGATELERAQRQSPPTPVSARLTHRLAGESESLQAIETVPGASDYYRVSTLGSWQKIGPIGAAGDYLRRLSIGIRTAAGSGVSTVQLRDGATNVIRTWALPVGDYDIELGMRSTQGPWWIQIQAGATGSEVLALARCA